ncbi:hypothetical protein BVG19_g3523 [[Candida] boidinii]|nr:hypothetical protein BVG19_g3523 [[Candida] boidinii]OWB52781.1 hypothetical protein B5S27_g4362 [[Candida] boidinii]
MSEEIQLKSKELIDKYLNLEKKPITYKIISRVLSISSAKSKRLLAEYYSENKDDTSVSLTNIITGIAIPKKEKQVKNETQPTEHSDKTETVLVKYISSKELTNIESIKTEIFKEVWSVEPYSLLPNENLQLKDIINSNESVLTKYELSPENLEKWGVIKNNIETIDLPTATSTSRPVSATQTTSVSDPPPLPPSNKDTKKTSGYVSRKSTEEKHEPPKADKEQIKKKPVSSYASRKNEGSNLNSQKGSDKKSSKDSDSSSKSNGYVYKSFKERQKEKEQLASAAAASKFDIETDADDNENNVETDAKDRKQTTVEKKKKKEKDLKLQSMFDDMDDEVEDETEGDIIEEKQEDVVDAQEIEPAASTNIKEGKQEAEEEDFSFMDDSGELSQLMDDKTATAGRSATADPNVEKYEDEDGFIVTRINKATPTPAKRSATHPAPSKKRQHQQEQKNHKIETSSATKRSKSKASSGKQSNLMSFFGAKK